MVDVVQIPAESPLANLDLVSYASDQNEGRTGVRMAEHPIGGRISLRGETDDRAFMAAVGQALDMVLPADPNTSASAGGVTAIWLGPDEWLLTTDADNAATLLRKLRDALAGLAAAIVDVSDAATVIALSGPNAHDVLAKGCPLDLHPSVFAPGRVAQTIVAQADAILHRVDDGGEASFDIHVRRSFAEYLWLWLADAGLEYGVGVDR